jgi:hypothetical protein
MIAVVGRDDVDELQAAATRAAVPTWLIGEIRPGTTGVRFSTR